MTLKYRNLLKKKINKLIEKFDVDTEMSELFEKY